MEGKEKWKENHFLTTDAGDLCRICWGVFPRLLGKQTNLEVEKHFKCDGLYLTPARALPKVQGANSSES